MDLFWRVAHNLYKREHMQWLARLLEIISMVLCSHAVSAQIELGKGSSFFHHGLGCVCIETTKIGCNTIIFQNVTFGANWHSVHEICGGAFALEIIV